LPHPKKLLSTPADLSRATLESIGYRPVAEQYQRSVKPIGEPLFSRRYSYGAENLPLVVRRAATLARLASSRMPAQKRDSKRNDIGLVGDESAAGLQNAYQHFRRETPRALYRSIKSCSNCH
jgi:hypothetical protein